VNSRSSGSIFTAIARCYSTGRGSCYHNPVSKIAEQKDVVVRFLCYARASRFEIRQVESLHEHYVLTLRAWGKNLETSAEQASRACRDVNYRIWKLYLAASAYSFEKANHSVFQSLLVKANQ
jgi:Mycolic acid cyclopropane synthetase